MTLFMTELSVADFAMSLAWYRDVLGLRVKHLDSANRFVLFDGGVALKRSPGFWEGEAPAEPQDASARREPRPPDQTPIPGRVVLHFRVSDLDAELARLGFTASSVVESAEGYREAFVADPDGYRIGLFEWT